MADQDADPDEGTDLAPMPRSEAMPWPHATPPPPKTLNVVRTARPEPDSFRRSEATFAGQIARAVARGQRVL